MEEPVLRPYKENPFYWQYKGEPILPLGATDTDHLFQWTGDRLTEHLDELVEAGGNYVRNTMSDRKEECVSPFKKLENGKFDLEKWNPEYWNRFENFLEETAKRDIIVQIEIWDPWDFAEGNWLDSPYNPQNNVNIEASEVEISGSKVTEDPMFEDHPFLLAAPSLNDSPTFYIFQKKFVRKVIETSLEYDHILYTVSNETSLPQKFSNYWADFLRKVANENNADIQLGDMRFAASAHPVLKYPERFDFVDVSQVGIFADQHHYEMTLRIRERLEENPAPMNVVKQYGSDVDKIDMTVSEDEAVNRFWRCLLAGCASFRFHRPKDFGIGLNERAKAMIKSARKLQEEFNFFEAEPNNELLTDRKVNEAYLMESEEKYLVYFTDGRSVGIEGLEEAEISFLDIERSEWKEKEPFSGRIEAPGEGQWAAVVEK